MKINHLQKKILFFILTLSLLLSGCSPKAAAPADAEATIAISGAFALYPMMTRWVEEYQKIHPNIKFDVSAGGAGKGMADTLAGAVEIGMVSRDITPEEEGKGAFWIGVTKDAVFPTVNASNPVLEDLLKTGLKRDTFIGIYITGEITTWGQAINKPEISDEIHVYTRSDAAGAPEVWAEYMDKKQEDLLGIGVFGDPGLTEAVVKDPLGIGFNNLGYAYDATTMKPMAGIVVLPIDYNENGVADSDELLETKEEAIEVVKSDKYPSPPARILNLVTNGKPTGVVAEFLQWIVTDGQAYVGEAGYVKLTEEQLTSALEKLK